MRIVYSDGEFLSITDSESISKPLQELFITSMCLVCVSDWLGEVTTKPGRLCSSLVAQRLGHPETSSEIAVVWFV